MTVESQEKIDNEHFNVHSTIGDMISRNIEEVQNKRLTIEIQNSIFSKMGYVLSPVGNHTKVVGWAEFDNEKNRNILEKAGGLLLEGLKRFVEYVEEGGDIDQYDKKAMLVPL